MICCDWLFYYCFIGLVSLGGSLVEFVLLLVWVCWFRLVWWLCVADSLLFSLCFGRLMEFGLVCYDLGFVFWVLCLLLFGL